MNCITKCHVHGGHWSSLLYMWKLDAVFRDVCRNVKIMQMETRSFNHLLAYFKVFLFLEVFGCQKLASYQTTHLIENKHCIESCRCQNTKPPIVEMEATMFRRRNTEAIFLVPLFSRFFTIVKTLVTYRILLSYLTHRSTWLRWHQPNMKVIQRT